MTEHFKWFDANKNKPSEGVRVLLKIQSEDNPVVGYWTGENWEVCTDNLWIEPNYLWHENADSGRISPEFYDSEVVSYMYIDMEG